MINEKGLCKILKSAYKGSGYTIIPQTFLADGPAGGYRSNEIVLNGSTWAIRCLTVDLPSEAAVQIVKDAGYLPVEAMLIQKGAPNQLVMEQTATARYGMLQRQGEEVLAMKKIPVIFKERWQLYQTEKGSVHAFDLELLNLIDFKGWDPPQLHVRPRASGDLDAGRLCRVSGAGPLLCGGRGKNTPCGGAGLGEPDRARRPCGQHQSV